MNRILSLSAAALLLAGTFATPTLARGLDTQVWPDSVVPACRTGDAPDGWLRVGGYCDAQRIVIEGNSYVPPEPEECEPTDPAPSI